MKIKITGLILIFIIMGMVPLLALQSCNSNIKSILPSENIEDPTTKEPPLNSTDQTLYGLIAAQFNEEWNNETLSAVSILIKTNYAVQPDKYNLKDNSVYITEQEMKDQWKEHYTDYATRIADSISKTKHLYICYKGVPVYTPYSSVSKGYTEKNETYTHLISVASPWDLFSAEKNTETMSGVSLNGLQFLTDSGEDSKSALLWYLPLCEIQTIQK